MIHIGVFLLADYTKSWLKSGILEELASCSRLTVFGHEAVINTIRRDLPEIETITIPSSKVSKSTHHLQQISLINRRKKSSSFQFRLKRTIFGELRIFPRTKKYSSKVFPIYYNLKRFIRYAFSNPLEFLSFVPWFGLFLEKYFLKKFLKISVSKFSSLVSAQKIDLALLPSAAIENQVFEMVQYLKSIRVKTVLCIENWDNLTSKSVLISEPDYVFVMGQFCAKHGVSIQNLPASKMRVAGIPRFNPYRKIVLENEKIDASHSSKKIRLLYLGFSVPHCETNLLNEIIRLLDASKLRDQYEFSYKPHPVRQTRFYESISLSDKIQVIGKNSSQSGFKAIPAIDQNHIQHILDADLIISTPTSMAIECMLLQKPIIIDGTDDGIHRTTAREALRNYVHLKDLKKIEGLSFGSSASDIVAKITAFKFDGNIQSRLNLEALIENDEPSYIQHILRMDEN